MSDSPAPNRKLALITGATGGIGKATALALAASGYSLALHYHSASESARNDLLAQIRAAQQSPTSTTSTTIPTPQVSFFQADLSSASAAESLWTAVTASALGHPLVVILNAGTTGGTTGPASIADVSPATFEQTWRTNTLAPYTLARLAVPAMVAQGYGRVVFTSSVAGMTGGVVGPHYASSKAALHGLVHWLASNVAAEGVTVNAVAPALIEDTAMLPGGGEGLRAKVPVGRLGRPEEVASTVLWMVGNGYVTNKVIAVDGGMVVQ